MQIHSLKSTSGRTSKQRIGRGGKRGTTAGRGTKGQRSRAGHRMRPELRDIIKKLPKLRGRGKNSNKSILIKPVTVTLGALEAAFAAGEAVNPKTLIAKKLISTARGQVPAVKILKTGSLTKKLMISSCQVSAAAQATIEQAGGSVAPRA